MISSLLLTLLLSPFPALSSERGQLDCPAAGELSKPCRVQRPFTADEVRSRISAGQVVTQEGDALTFVSDAEAESVELGGGLQYPLARIEGTNLWHVTLRVPRVEEALVSYFFIPTSVGAPRAKRFTSELWRGPAAPPEPVSAKALSREMLKHEIDSRHLGEKRTLFIYEPPGDAPLAGVIYAGDGGGVEPMAKMVEPRILSGELPRVLLVGIASAETSEGRGADYLLDMDDANRRFLAHERFFLEEVMPWVEARYTLPNDRMKRATFGFSNSAAWALEMVLRHPERIGRAIPFSVAGRKAKLTAPPCPAPTFYLLGGTLEPPFHQKAVDWSKLFDAHGIANVLREPVAGHDFKMWAEQFPAAVAWAFGRGTKNER
jgi:enterochelin esterase-like enzyme